MKKDRQLFLEGGRGLGVKCVKMEYRKNQTDFLKYESWVQFSIQLILTTSILNYCFLTELSELLISFVLQFSF